MKELKEGVKMRPSRNAILGYSYQKMIALFLLTKMDVEREIVQIEIEADVTNNFDDVTINFLNRTVYCQMKDFKDVKLSQLKRINDAIIIKGTIHKLSEQENVIFIKNIDINPNTNFLGIPAYDLDGILIISLSRDFAWEAIYNSYRFNEKRISILERFFDKTLDERSLIINRSDLPPIDIYSTDLMEKTIILKDIILDDSNIIKIEGKPGVGKSHLVEQLKLNKEKILYRFWVSNQDKNYKERLEYKNFISNITKELFQNYQSKTEEEIIFTLREKDLILVIDGLDHVENYNVHSLPYFINFINKVSLSSKVIVLSRPLKTETNWPTYIINNWNYEQSVKFLNELYHITDYSITKKLYGMTNGYPILLSFLAKHYKEFKLLPEINEIKDIDDYYNQIAKNINTKSALTLFLTSHSFFMESEINDLLEDELTSILKEFIKSYPYLFDIRLNRISLVHDSFNTYLKKLNINYDSRKHTVHQKVFNSIISGEVKYLSRFIYFDFSPEVKLQVVEKYSNIDEFKRLMNNCIDFESIQEFYNQVRQVIHEINPNSLSTYHYYDLSLILNLIHRDHISNLNSFLYTYTRSLVCNGYKPDHITSSGYVFSMLYFLLEGNIDLLENVTSDDNYSTDYFYDSLLNEIDAEESYFDHHLEPLILTQQVKYDLESKQEYKIKDLISYILINAYIHGSTERKFKEIHKSIICYIDRNEQEKAIKMLEKTLIKYGVRPFFAKSLLLNSKNKLESLGVIRGVNKYKNLTLRNYIEEYSYQGSFEVLDRVQNYLRLALKDNRKIDISSICLFWTMYNNRKDYSVINLFEALRVFEKLNLINEIESCEIIVTFQKMSEKGIRHLLENYIETHKVNIIEILEENFDLTELQVEWFNLPIEYINNFSQELFEIAFKRIIRYHSVSRKIRINDIENVLNSIYGEQVLEILANLNYTIEIPEHHFQKQLLEKDICIEIVDDEQDNRDYKRNSLDRYNQGILTSEDIDFIKKNELKLHEVAGFTDGNYSLLSDLNIFHIYTKEEIKQNIRMILYNSMLGKIRSINMYGNLYYFIGNVPKLIFENDININWKEIFSSFNVFLELSLINGDVIKFKKNN